MLTSYPDTLSIQMTPPPLWKLAESLPTVFDSLSLRYSFNAGTVSSARAPPPADSIHGRRQPRSAPFPKGGIMLISEFYSKFMAGQEGSRLFDALRRVSRLEKGALMASGEEPPGWAEWPPIDPEAAGFQLKKA